MFNIDVLLQLLFSARKAKAGKEEQCSKEKTFEMGTSCLSLLSSSKDKIFLSPSIVCPYLHVSDYKSLGIRFTLFEYHKIPHR